MDVRGDHASVCRKGSGGVLGSWKIRRHDDVRDVLFRLATAAGLQPQKEANVPTGGRRLRPGDILVCGDGGGMEPRYGGRHTLNDSFMDTSYDVTITATQTLSSGSFGFSSAAGGVGSKADTAYKNKACRCNGTQEEGDSNDSNRLCSKRLVSPTRAPEN